MNSKATLPAAHGITMREAPIETPGAIGVAERYHAPLRISFNKISETMDKGDALHRMHQMKTASGWLSLR